MMAFNYIIYVFCIEQKINGLLSCNNSNHDVIICSFRVFYSVGVGRIYSLI